MFFLFPVIVASTAAVALVASLSPQRTARARKQPRAPRPKPKPKQQTPPVPELPPEPPPADDLEERRLQRAAREEAQRKLDEEAERLDAELSQAAAARKAEAQRLEKEQREAQLLERRQREADEAEAQRKREVEKEAQRLDQLKRTREAQQLRAQEADRLRLEATLQQRRDEEAERLKREAELRRLAEEALMVTPLVRWLNKYAGQYKEQLRAKLGLVGPDDPQVTSMQLCEAIVQVLPGELIDKLEADHPALKPELALCERKAAEREAAPAPRPPEPPAPEPAKPRALPAPEPAVEPPAPQPVPEAVPKPAPVLKAREAAERLYIFASMKLQAGQGEDLGTKDNPSPMVETLQASMRRIKVDGQYGQETRARGKELLGRDFPIRRRVIPPQERGDDPTPPIPEPPPPPPPVVEHADQLDDQVATRSPKRAARDLFEYVDALGTQGRAAALGVGDTPSPFVEAAQADMLEIDADGYYGQKTRRRGKALLGISFPPR